MVIVAHRLADTYLSLPPSRRAFSLLIMLFVCRGVVGRWGGFEAPFLPVLSRCSVCPKGASLRFVELRGGIHLHLTCSPFFRFLVLSPFFFHFRVCTLE